MCVFCVLVCADVCVCVFTQICVYPYVRVSAYVYGCKFVFVYVCVDSNCVLDLNLCNQANMAICEEFGTHLIHMKNYNT